MKAIHTINRFDVLPSSAIQPSLRGGVATHVPLWVGGVAALCLLLAFMVKVPLTAISARADVWTPYLVLGTLFPLVVAAVVLLERSGRALPASVGLLLIALPITAVAHFAGVGRNLLAVGLALVQTVLYLMMAGWSWPRIPLHFSLRRQPPGSTTVEIALKPLSLQATQMVALFIMGFLAWAVVLEMMTWEMAAVMRPPQLYEFIAGALALLACCWWASGREIPTNRLWTWARGIISAGSVIILVLLAFRTDGLFTTDRLDSFNLPGSYLHWGAFVGPAEAVRQGGWLLWDVPFQYGFLTTLSLAALPVPTAWQALYLFNAVSSALVAVFLFVVLRAVRPTVVGTIVAGAVTAAVVFLLPAQPILLAPVHYLPSNGVIRHWWCYVLVAVLLLERRQAPRSRAQQGVLLIGCVCWLLAILWSAESAFYGSAIWLPAFGLIVLRDYGGLGGASDWKRLIAWLAVPPLLLVGMVGGLVVLYQHFLGQGPDWRAYVDALLAFAGAFRDGFGSTDPNNTIVVVLFGFLLLAMAAASLARMLGGLREVPLAMALAFGVWALSSYAVGLPWPTSIYRQIPFLILGLGILLGIIAPRYITPPATWVSLLKAGTIPLLVALLVTAYTNVSQLRYQAYAIRREGFIGRDVTVGLPHVEPSLAALLTEAKVKASDPILYSGEPYGDMMPVWVPAGESEPVVVSRQWMAGPLTILGFLADERKQRYMQRYAERQVGGGWLIERREEGVVVDQEFSLDPWFFAQVDRTHTPTKIAQNADWQLVWYEPQDGSGAALAGQRTGRVPGVPSDLLVNGESLADSVLPPVWGYFGPEWTDPAIDGLPRCASGSGTLYLFTPAPLEALVALNPPGEGFAGTLQVVVNDGEAAEAVSRRRGDTVQAPLSLAAGWNTLTIEMTGGGLAAPDAADTVDSCATADPADSILRLKTINLRLGASVRDTG